MYKGELQQFFIEKSPSFKALRESLNKDNFFVIESVIDSQKGLIAGSLTNDFKNILIITGGIREDSLFENLSFFQKDNLIEIPSFDLFLDGIEPSPDIIGKRMESFYELSLKKDASKIILCNLQTALQKLLPIKSISSLFLNLKKGDEISLDKLAEKLINMGYERAPIVSDKKQFAVRGCILDVFPTSADSPYRLEFFGDTIDNIRTFDFMSQKSIEKVPKVFICPGNELSLLKKQKEFSSIIDFLDDNTLVIFDDLLAIEDSWTLLKSQNNLLLDLDTFLSVIQNLKKIFFSKEPIEMLSEVKKGDFTKFFTPITFEMFQKPFSAKKWHHPFQDLSIFIEDKSIIDCVPEFLEQRFSLLFINDSEQEEKVLKEKLASSEQIFFERGYISSGFVIMDTHLVIISGSDLSHKTRVRRQKYRSTFHLPSSEFHQLSVNDLVVHYHSGIGKYLGIEKLSNHLGQDTEFFVLEYAENSKQYVPISQAHLISRYIGSHDEMPTLSTLGSTKWQKTKETAQKQIIGYASDLLNLYAQRELEGGFVFAEDSEDFKLFELDFPYQETSDQLNAIEDIKKDMMSTKPMDRLICGDVGYGKTEVAIRAAIKAVLDGKKQVAVLVPTTVLAMQHYESFKERCSNFAANIEVVSRFHTAKQNQKTLQDLKEGKIDIIIGTHRILSQDVQFKDLGMIIIDEEQRFGVRAKEHLKKLKKGVDCITLSATPIPRTLYMSLVKVKDMSVINTPPQDRLPIKTIIAENEDNIIKNALLRELAREGQSFFIHNRVESIYQREDYIKKLLPKARTGVVHGQMPADGVDTIFHSFKNGEMDILFSTTLIENGIDIPNANTILIDRADTFGLADLYQLRGRVGRWNRVAYAYFLIPKNKEVSEISRKRLNALLESGGYGGGMKLAMRDLEIRGAGDILGIKQSGQVSSIGFHLYCKLLKKTIESLKNKKKTSFIETKMDFPFTASLPESYINETSLRMEIYHRLGEVNSYQELDKIIDEIKDRFGPLPEDAIYLYHLTRIRIFASLNQFTLLKFTSFTLYAEQLYKTKVTKTLMLSKISSAKALEETVIAQLQKSFECPYTSG
ncbi:MAG: transcription-repair coupling factor [Chlamydiae bacterium]|nr:transcription-repair coupling factor [Chlamydiota bacterium]